MDLGETNHLFSVITYGDTKRQSNGYWDKDFIKLKIIAIHLAKYASVG